MERLVWIYRIIRLGCYSVIWRISLGCVVASILLDPNCKIYDMLSINFYLICWSFKKYKLILHKIGVIWLLRDSQVFALAENRACLIKIEVALELIVYKK